MTPDLDSLATALYVKTDDLLKASPHLAPWRPAVGITPKLTDAELVTLAVMQAMLGFTSEAKWLRVTRLPAIGTSVWSDDVWKRKPQLRLRAWDGMATIYLIK